MGRYIFRRLAQATIVVVALQVIVFFVVSVLGDPVAIMSSSDATPEQIEAYREKLGLNRSLPEQFLNFLLHALQGDLGDSIWQGRPALQVVSERLPATLILAAVTIGFAVVVAIPLGAIAAMRPGKLIDRIVQVGSFTFAAIPEFWLALMLILVLSVWGGILPSSGYGEWQNIVLPVITLSLGPIGRIAQFVRSSMIEQLREPYAVTARSKGIGERRVVQRHVLKNSLAPTAMLITDDLAGVIGGAVIVETIFGWPGIGYLSIQAIEHRDVPVVQTVVLVVALLVVAVNLLGDMLQLALDPRVRRS